MTVFHYIAANRDILTGVFPEKTNLVPISDISGIKIKGLEFKKTKVNNISSNLI
ncbi:hypothetical protein [Sutcliffiella halmapala]|uniref:hypothetical protein n=1 Tax=Sutcliffiella halmapala TaxID=79882 RepID=UPI00147623A4|nr:hypothetical protein [Sutcliffiella halmapala]